MSPDRIFSLCNSAALLGWLVLVFAGRKRWAGRLITGVVLPLIFGVVYAALVIENWGLTPGGFGSLAAVASLFSNRWMLLAGWIHYLAFDLFVGSWEVGDAQEKGINHVLVIPSLVLTFLFGPAGLLLYYLTRTIVTRSAGLRPDPGGRP
jgi:membrane protein insertase Oxa1/YidC/SpoIIIJ